MSSLSAKDRVSLCSFTFSDGRRCRSPRDGKQSHFCFDHAEKEAQARAADNLGKDLAYFFSGDYLSACDLSTALARLIPAVVRGDVKPRTARTVAYLLQTLMQAIHISQQEYINAFGTDDWRKSIRNSVNDNYDYRFPPAPEPQQSALTARAFCAPDESAERIIPASTPTSARPATNPSPTTCPRPTASNRRNAESRSQSHTPAIRRNTRKLSFRAQRGTCFRIHLIPNSIPWPTNTRSPLHTLFPRLSC